jgi:hypothetical protein
MAKLLGIAMLLLAISGCDGPVCEPGYTFCTQANAYLARCDTKGNMQGYDCAAQCKKLGAKAGYCAFASAMGNNGCVCSDGQQWAPP